MLSLQLKYGTLFFLPGKWRKKSYDKYIKYLKDEHDESGGYYWNLCTNALRDPELNYNEQHHTFSYYKFERLAYFELPCSHKFHPNWILLKLKEKLSCPVWDIGIPKNVYLD